MNHLLSSTQDGPLKELRPITVGRRCIVGTKSYIGAGTVLEDGASVGLLTHVPGGTRVPAQQVSARASQCQSDGSCANVLLLDDSHPVCLAGCFSSKMSNDVTAKARS